MSPVTHSYFDPALYPPPSSEATHYLNKYQPWWNLKRDLMVAAHEEGNPICSNGYTRDKSMRTFLCSCFGWTTRTVLAHRSTAAHRLLRTSRMRARMANPCLDNITRVLVMNDVHFASQSHGTHTVSTWCSATAAEIQNILTTSKLLILMRLLFLRV